MVGREEGAKRLKKTQSAPTGSALRTCQDRRTCAIQMISYLSGAIQFVRNFHEFSFCFRANVAAIPFQCNTVDHHKTKADRSKQKVRGLSVYHLLCNIFPMK